MSSRSISARTVLGIILIASATSCATAKNGRYQQVHVESSPSGADVVVNGGVVAHTPANVKLRRQWRQTVVIHKPGYREQAVAVSGQPNAWTLLNYLFVPGILVDFATGAGIDLSPEEISVTLYPEDVRASAPDSP